MSDLTVDIDNGVLNVRVGAIIMKDHKYLMVGEGSVDFLYSVGGRIKLGETAEEAVVREVYEETGVHMEVDRLGFIHENFFQINYPAIDATKAGKQVYEIAFFFYMKVPEDFTPVCNSLTGSGEQEQLYWVDAQEERTCYPEFFRTELQNPCDYVKHIVTR